LFGHAPVVRIKYRSDLRDGQGASWKARGAHNPWEFRGAAETNQRLDAQSLDQLLSKSERSAEAWRKQEECMRRLDACAATAKPFKCAPMDIKPHMKHLPQKLADSNPLTAPREGYRTVAIWVWSLAALVFLMVIAGGATRLTESGLSITEWKPLTGVIPPLSEAQWQAEFENYKSIPQYAELFPGMDLRGFKFIFFFEWGHRLLGRLIGAVMAVPLIVFWARGLLPRGFKPKLLGVLALGALQGFVGWWMVKSGLTERVEVAQERLAIHLLLASATFGALTWLASSLKRGASELPQRVLPGLKWLAWATVLLVLLQIGLGALVAGLRAGRAFNTWPLIDGNFWPPFDKLTVLTPLWRNVLDNILLVQFQHRMAAYALLALALVQGLYASRVAPGSRAMRRTVALAGLATTQAAIGIVTLLLVVPLWAGLLHQAFAMIVLGMAVAHAQALSQAR
jgi:heme a synthase